MALCTPRGRNVGAEDGWYNTGEEITVTYTPVTVEADGTRILIAEGAVPDGMPVEIHMLGLSLVKAIYADGYVDHDRATLPGAEGDN